MRLSRSLLLLALLPFGTPPILEAQVTDPPHNGNALYVFLDCQARYCDFDHFRREITWVNWMRDRQDADLHVLVTSQRTGGGGLGYELDYIGRRRFDGQQDTLRYVSDPTDTDAEVRDGLTRTLALGLAPFAARAGFGPQLRITRQTGTVAAQPLAGQQDDPWNLWVFRINANGSVDLESQERGFSVRGGANANRTSESHKFNWGMNGRYSRDEFDLDDSTTVENVSWHYGTHLRSVWSLSENWSAGVGGGASGSTFNNRRFSTFVGPAIEYNIFPYALSTRKSITFLYSVEFVYSDYDLVTVNGKTTDALGRHRLEINAGIQQPWGEIHGFVSGTQYFNDLATHRIDMGSRTEFRVFRGFNLNFNVNFARIKDQFFLPAVGATPEEILLRRRQRETDFEFGVSMGVSFRFGSRFANIVNPRMGGGF